MDYEKEDWSPENGKMSPGTNILMIVVLLAIILGGGYFLMQYSTKLEDRPNSKTEVTIKTMKENKGENVVINEIRNPENNTDTNQSGIESPEIVVQNFYQWLMDEDDKSLENYKKHSSVDESLISFIDLAKNNSSIANYNPFFCAASKPVRFEALIDKIDGNTTHVMVNAHHDYVQPIRFGLKMKDNAWKIFNVTCLDRNSIRGVLENLKKEIGLDYVTVEPTTFTWNQASDKSRGGKTVTGEKVETQNASITAGAIAKFFHNQGFTTDEYNQGGYQKDNMVCVTSQSKNANGNFDVSIKCATR